MRRLQSIREQVESNDVAVGARAATFSPAIIETYGTLGLDYAWLDFEHGGPSAYDAHEIASYVRTAISADVDLLVRLPSVDPPLIRRVLDAGVRTVLLPRVETAAEVRRAVEAATFQFDGDVGERGIGGERSSGWGEFPDRYIEREDDSIFVGAMIENESAVANIEDILDVPQLGFVFVGPADLSVSLGHPLETDHSSVIEAVETVRSAAETADVPIGRITADGDQATRAKEAGYRILRIGDEIGSTREVLGERVREL